MPVRAAADRASERTFRAGEPIGRPVVIWGIRERLETMADGHCRRTLGVLLPRVSERGCDDQGEAVAALRQQQSGDARTTSVAAQSSGVAPRTSALDVCAGVQQYAEQSRVDRFQRPNAVPFAVVQANPNKLLSSLQEVRHDSGIPRFTASMNASSSDIVNPPLNIDVLRGMVHLNEW